MPTQAGIEEMQSEEMTMTSNRAFDKLVQKGGPATSRQRFGRVLLPAAALLMFAGGCWAQTAEDVRLTVGKSVVIDYPADIRQISTSDPLIIDASTITTREILLNAKSLGNATMVVWNKADQRMFYNVTVELNLEPLRRILQD